MTVSEAMKRLAELPADAMFCYSDGQLIIECTQIELVRVETSGDHYAALDDGDKTVATCA